MKKRALISVSDKRGLKEFAGGLTELGYEIVSTGGTAKALKGAGVKVTMASEVTGFPEILEGRVKTLHPNIHAGILARGDKSHMQQLEELGIEPFDMVVVNLYPFRETVAKPGVNLEEAIENIDIGGPSMVRAAAKNFARVAVIVNPERYEEILNMLKENGDLDGMVRLELALEAFTHTAEYDMAISTYLSGIMKPGEFPDTWFTKGEKIQKLRYGENPHQQAAYYKLNGNIEGTLAQAKQLHGKELSYNNIVDVQAAWNIAAEFEGPGAVVIKHTNPCGAAIADDLCTAYKRAFAADSISAYGGIVGLNRAVDEDTAKEIEKTFLEAVIAPSFTPEALAVLTAKKNLRLLEMGNKKSESQEYWIEPVSGGFLVQEIDKVLMQEEDIKVVSQKEPDEEMLKELLFAWKVVKHVKSNAIVITGDKQTLGVGAGQMNRVGAARIALEQAGDKARGAVLASDAFFPFSDTVELAARRGIRGIIQPGGSIRDEDTIKKANEYGLVMIFTGMRHFKH